MGPGRKEIRDFHPVYPGHPFYGMDYLRFIGIGRFFAACADQARQGQLTVPAYHLRIKNQREKT